ncbi:hypothetical protein OGCDGJMD_00822 [Cyanobium usitatum str. Tous]|nr:hypothetical protein OGCDGJMD_00822 [Cyanobium usitatum str. Tous]
MARLAAIYGCFLLLFLLLFPLLRITENSVGKRVWAGLYKLLFQQPVDQYHLSIDHTFN